MGGILINNNISWNEFNNKMNQVFGKSFKNVDELYFNVTREIVFGEETELSDLDALKYLQDLHEMTDMLYVITDVCYENKCGPFVVKADEIHVFVEFFYSKYNEAFYSTDIVIINFEKRLIWFFFHEGVCWLSEC